MITFPCSLVQQLRAVFRRALRLTNRDAGPDLLFAAGPDGLRVQAQNIHGAVQHHTPGDFAAEQIRLPFTFLTECEGPESRAGHAGAGIRGQSHRPMDRQEDPATRAVRRYIRRHPGLPDHPACHGRERQQLVASLGRGDGDDRADPIRYATNCVKLCGSGGKIVATDGRQMLVQSGFSFPWEDDLLVPST